jgi:hypothetical protein
MYAKVMACSYIPVIKKEIEKDVGNPKMTSLEVEYK